MTGSCKISKSRLRIRLRSFSSPEAALLLERYISCFLHDQLNIFGQVTDSLYKDTRSRSYEAKSIFFVLFLANLSLFAMYESEEHYEGEVSFFQLLKYHALSC